MLVSRFISRRGCHQSVSCARSKWTGQETLEQDDPEMWSLIQQEKQRQVSTSPSTSSSSLPSLLLPLSSLLSSSSKHWVAQHTLRKTLYCFNEVDHRHNMIIIIIINIIVIIMIRCQDWSWLPVRTSAAEQRWQCWAPVSTTSTVRGILARDTMVALR